MDKMWEYLPNAFTTPGAEAEIVERLNKIADVFGDQRRVWDLLLRSRESMIGSQYVKDELRRRGNTSADVVILERILFATDIATSLVPDGFNLWHVFARYVLIKPCDKQGEITDIFTYSDEDIRHTLTWVRPPSPRRQSI